MKNVALITGASSGIGKEFAKIHAQNGGDLVIVARNASKLNQLKSELKESHNTNVKVIVKDLSKTNAALEIYEQIKMEGINIEYLINNAGFGGQGKFHERSWEQDLAMINLNVIALTALTRYFLPDFVKRNSGRILNVSSTASLFPGPLQAVYYATKAYVTSFSNAIGEELHDTNITVSALLPGATETEFARASGLENTDLFNKTFTPKVVAKIGYEGMLKGKRDILAGLSFIQKVFMATVPITPKKILLTQIRKMQELKS